MKKLGIILGVLGLGLATAGVARAQTTATQTFSTTLSTIRAISVSTSTAVDLTINAATPGSAPTTVGDSTTTYAITSNDPSNVKISGRISSGTGAADTLPTNASLTVHLAAPTGATTAGPVALTTTDQNLVTAIAAGNHSSLQIAYRLTALSTVAPWSAKSRTITFTIAAGS